MERYVIQADLFMPHLIIASCDGGWLILMGWQPSILSMDLQRGAFYFSELAIIFFFAFWSECLGFMEHTSHAQFIFTMALCKCMLRLRPPAPGVGPCSPLLKVQTLQLWASHFIRVTLGIDISVSRRNRKDINKYQCQFFRQILCQLFDLEFNPFEMLIPTPKKSGAWHFVSKHGTALAERGLERLEEA